MSMREALKPKSDQLNADDLIGDITKIITVTKVTIKQGADQPIVINFEGDNNKPWKPCKGMGRVLMALWGEDEHLYIGRQIELYRDANVRWAGEAVGGIRIKSISHIDKQEILALTISRGKKQHFVINPLKIQQPKQEVSIEDRVTKAIQVLNSDNVSDKIINAASNLLDGLSPDSELHYDLTTALTPHLKQETTAFDNPDFGQ